MNFVKRLLIGGTKSRIGASGRVGALLLPVSDLFAGLWGLANSSCSLMGLARRLLQKLCRAQDSRAIAMEI